MADRPGPTKPGTPGWVKAFGLVFLVLIVLVVLMLTGVLGEGHGPGRHLGGAGNTMGDNRIDVGTPASAEEAARTVEIAARDTMAFEPSRIDVAAGETVTFEVTNTGQTVHEFTVGDAAMQQEHAQARAHMPAGVMHSFPNSITLQPGETKQITWRFGGAGTLEYASHQSGHYAAGMRGRIKIS